MARIRKEPEGIAANRPQAVPTKGRGELSGGGVRVEGVHGPISHNEKFVAKADEVVGMDLGNLDTAVTSEPANVTGNLGKKDLLGQGATPAGCEKDNKIVPQRGEYVNSIHSAARKYADAGIAIYPVSEKGKMLQPSTTDPNEVDRWFREAAEAAARVEASRKVIADAKLVNQDAEAWMPQADDQRRYEDIHQERIRRWIACRALVECVGDGGRAFEEGLRYTPIEFFYHVYREGFGLDYIARGEAAATTIKEEEGKIKAELAVEAPAALRLDFGYIAVEKDGALSILEGDLSEGDLGNGARIVSRFDNLPLDPVPVAPMPAWVVDAWWGEEFRGTPLDSPKAVAAAKRFLATAPRETDGPHRIKRDLAKINHQLADHEIEDRYRRDLEQERDALEEKEPYYETTREVADKLLNLGLSKVRATTLMRVVWNQRNKPQLSDALIRELVDKAWAIEEPDSVAREWRWQFRDPKEAGSVDDLLFGDVAEKDWLLGQIMAAGSRTMLYGPTGKGKTMVCLSWAMRVAAGLDFVHWTGSQRPRKVVYVDGDMSYDDMRLRVRQEYARMGKVDISGFKLLSHEKVKLPKLDTEEGRRVVDAYIEEHGADLVVFDNLQSLLSDTGKEAWGQVLDWTKELTARGIAQLWQHHTGHDERHAYGDKTREWGLDTVIHLRTHKAEPSELIVSLGFEKVRGIRTTDHDTVQVQLAGNRWSSSGGPKPGNDRAAMIEALLIEHGHVNPEHRIWEPDLAALLNPDDAEPEKKRLRDNHRERPYSHLCVKDGNRWYWFTQASDQD